MVILALCLDDYVKDVDGGEDGGDDDVDDNYVVVVNGNDYVNVVEDYDYVDVDSIRWPLH